MEGRVAEMDFLGIEKHQHKSVWSFQEKIDAWSRLVLVSGGMCGK